MSTSANRYRIPTPTADPTAAWVAEGAEIPISDPTLAELSVTPAKVAGLTIVSRELADDSNPAAANVVVIGLARDIARKVDAGAFADLDAFAEAISLAETVGATVTSFVTSPATALALAKVKTGTGSNAPLLGQDATSATSRFAGRPHAAATPPRRLAALGDVGRRHRCTTTCHGKPMTSVVTVNSSCVRRPHALGLEVDHQRATAVLDSTVAATLVTAGEIYLIANDRPVDGSTAGRGPVDRETGELAERAGR